MQKNGMRKPFGWRATNGDFSLCLAGERITIRANVSTFGRDRNSARSSGPNSISTSAIMSVKASESPDPTVTVPRLIAFNGVLRDSSNRPLSGVVGVGFALYKDQEGGGPLWTEIRAVGADGKPADAIPLKGGYFETQLPKAFFEGNPKSITVTWIDFFRG